MGSAEDFVFLWRGYGGESRVRPGGGCALVDSAQPRVSPFIVGKDSVRGFTYEDESGWVARGHLTTLSWRLVSKPSDIMHVGGRRPSREDRASVLFASTEADRDRSAAYYQALRAAGAPEPGAPPASG